MLQCFQHILFLPLTLRVCPVYKTNGKNSNWGQGTGERVPGWNERVPEGAGAAAVKLMHEPQLLFTMDTTPFLLNEQLQLFSDHLCLLIKGSLRIPSALCSTLFPSSWYLMIYPLIGGRGYFPQQTCIISNGRNTVSEKQVPWSHPGWWMVSFFEPQAHIPGIYLCYLGKSDGTYPCFGT